LLAFCTAAHSGVAFLEAIRLRTVRYYNCVLRCTYGRFFGQWAELWHIQVYRIGWLMVKEIAGFPGFAGLFK
jgi:hypothetical protein